MAFTWTNIAAAVDATWVNPVTGDTLSGRGGIAVSGTNDTLTSASVSLVSPNTDVITSSQITFVWDMADNVSECAITIRKGSSTGPIVYNGPANAHFVAPVGRLVPGTTSLTRRHYTFPIHTLNTFPTTSADMANAVTFDNGIYYWGVTVYNRLNNSVAVSGSSMRSFTVDVGSGSGTARDYVTVNLSYNPYAGAIGNALTNSTCIRVQAFENAGFTGLPAAEVQVNMQDFTYGGTIVRLHGLKKDASYYVRAYIDCNNNRIRDIWEPYGYVCIGAGPNRFDPIRVPALSSDPLEKDLHPLVIVNADTDGDRISDGWEYIMTKGVGNWLGVYGFDKYASLTGMSDLQLAMEGYNPLEVYSMGNGVSDYTNVALGMSALGDDLSLQLTSFGLGDLSSGKGTSLGWKATIRNEMGIMSEREFEPNDEIPVTYVIEYTTNLRDKDSWTVVESFTLTNGVGDHVIQDGFMMDPNGGFFRARRLD